jgi:hypothetical protein
MPARRTTPIPRHRRVVSGHRVTRLGRTLCARWTPAEPASTVIIGIPASDPGGDLREGAEADASGIPSAPPSLLAASWLRRRPRCGFWRPRARPRLRAASCSKTPGPLSQPQTPSDRRTASHDRLNQFSSPVRDDSTDYARVIEQERSEVGRYEVGTRGEAPAGGGPRRLHRCRDAASVPTLAWSLHGD